MRFGSLFLRPATAPTREHTVDASAPAVVMQGLEVGYAEAVCPPLTVQVRAGDVVALVGANGSGKSTVLRTAGGLLEPLRGSLTVFGAMVDERLRAYRALVAAELGDDAFFPALTVREHLLLICFGHGVGEPDEVTDRQLELFGLTGRADALPAALSSGQRRRLLLASVFARPRRLLLLDEPEQRLDRHTRSLLGDLLARERDCGGAVLMATHDPDLVRAVATTVVVISEHSVRVMDGVTGAAAIGREP